MNDDQPEPRKPLCPDAWAIPPSPIMLKHGNDYYTCSLCGEPCDVVDLKADAHPQPLVGDDELRERIRVITKEPQLYPSTNSKGYASASPMTNQIISLVQAHTDAAVKAARIDELGSVQLECGRYTVTTYMNGKEQSITERIKELKEG